MSVEQKMRDYVLENFLFTDDQSAINNEDSFLKKGIIDSRTSLSKGVVAALSK